MEGLFVFILNSILLGVGLAMDAFSVSAANGLREPEMPRRRAFLIAGTFAFFQFLMPVAGWFCVRTVASYFSAFEKVVPWIAFLLLLFIGGKMLLEGIRGKEGTETKGGELLVQGIATSIDALSVGFAFAGYGTARAFAASLIIAAVTLLICLAGIRIGRAAGTRLAGKAQILGGVILIGIGIEILLTGIL